MPARWLLLLVLLLPWRAHATIFLAWEFDRAYQPVPTGFDLALEGPISPGKGSVTQTIRVGPSAPWACAFLPDDVFETFCAELACPGPGIFKATAYAIWADRKSGPSNTSTMEVVTAPVCAALRIEIPPEKPPTGAPPTPCDSLAYRSQTVPMSTTTTIPGTMTITAEPKPPTMTPPPLPVRPQLPAQVRTVAPVIVPRVAPKAVHRVGASTPVASATVSAGPPVEVPVQQPAAPPPVLPPCP